MKNKACYIVFSFFILIILAWKGAPVPQNIPNKIYFNGRILTIDSANTIVQAVAIENGRIVAVGSNASVNKRKGRQTKLIDLKGKTMIPGLINGHSHFMSLTRFTSADISQPPMGTVKNIPGIIAELVKFKQEKKIKPGEWIRARGYDADQLQEKRHPVKEDLDVIFPDNPVVLTHISGHMSVANSAALKISGVDAATKDPAGGQIVRKSGTHEPTGLLLEKATSLLKIQDSKPLTLTDRLQILKDQQTYYASFGITTAQDGGTNSSSLELLTKAAEQKQLFLDLEVLPTYSSLDKILENPVYKFGEYRNRLKLRGFKLIADGSPQGKTAFFTKPFLTPVPGCDHDCTGMPTVSQAQLDAAVLKGFQNNIQVYVHCNGDATIDMYIQAIEKANTKLGDSSVKRRPVVIHSQFVRPDQLDKFKQLSMIPALFTNHAFFWGDTHTENLGKERADFLSPLKTALKKSIVATNHTDFGVTPINQMFLLWTSVVRQSRSGRIIGPAERLTPMEGLRAITINGAYQYFEEKNKGSIELGKLADFAILSADPTQIDPGEIKDIEVLETIKEGRTIFKR